MTINQIKILNNKIRQNKADYSLTRKNAEITALNSGKSDKYEYLTDLDLGYKPDPIQKAKFEYSPLGELFNKGLDKNEKQEGLLKKLKNIEDKTNNQSDLVRDQGYRQLGKIERSLSNKEVVGFYEGTNKGIKDLENKIIKETSENINDEKKILC